MKLDFLNGGGRPPLALPSCSVHSEVDPLTDVLLCSPAFLTAVPCCSVTRDSLRAGFEVSVDKAMVQHRQLVAALERHGVRCHMMPPRPDMPDMCFTRDALLTSPWGLITLRPAAAHRRDEGRHAFDYARSLGAPPAAHIRHGTIEGGDIAIVRPGLIVIGWSGERTDEAGAEALADVFRGQRWDVILYRFHPYHLHLDTQFSMVADDLALACIDVLDEGFVRQLERAGIELIPVERGEARKLGCNLLSLGNGVILSSAHNERVNRLLSDRGFEIEAIDIDQFTRCGGGIHCLTMPLARQSRQRW